MKGWFLLFRGALHQHSRLADAAQADLEVARSVAQATGSPILEARILTQFARNSIIVRRLLDPSADSLLDRAQAIIGKDGHLAASISFLRGAKAQLEGRIDSAIEHLDQSIGLARLHKAPLLLFPALNSLGDALCYQEDYHRAAVCFEECLSISQDLNAPYQVALHLNNLGTVYHVQNDLDRASRYYIDSLAQCRKIDDLEGAATALCNLGETAVQRGEMEQAWRYAKEASLLADSLRSDWTAIIAENLLAEIEIRRGEADSGLEILRRVSQRAIKAGPVFLQLRILLTLGRGLTGRDDFSAARLMRRVASHPASEPDVRKSAEEWLKERHLEGEEKASPGEFIERHLSKQ